jgi:hypothetical protein
LKNIQPFKVNSNRRRLILYSRNKAYKKETIFIYNKKQRRFTIKVTPQKAHTEAGTCFTARSKELL